MVDKKVEMGEQQFDKESARAGEKKYVLRLYVTGENRKSLKAIANLKRICEEHLADRYELEIIDITGQPKLAKGDQIIATPTLIRQLPEPLRKLIGDMSDEENVLLGMDLKLKK
jgi:circadian clock protein KaiB